MAPECFNKWTKDYLENRKQTYGPADTMELVSFDILSGIYETFCANSDGVLRDRLKGFDDDFVIYNPHDDNCYMVRGFLQWPPPHIAELLFLCNGWSMEGSGMKDNGGAANILKSFEEFASLTYGSDMPSVQARSTQDIGWCTRYGYFTPPDFVKHGSMSLTKPTPEDEPRLWAIMCLVFWGKLYSAAHTVYYVRLYQIIVIQMALDQNPEILPRTARLKNGPIFPCEYFSLFYKLEREMLIADKQMLANGGSFNGTLAEMITQEPNSYIPQLPGWAKVPLAPSSS